MEHVPAQQGRRADLRSAQEQIAIWPEQAAPRRNDSQVTAVPFGQRPSATEPAPSSETEWPDARKSVVQQGDLRVRVVAVSIQPASFSTQQLASRYAISMSARIELKDMRENKVLWENPSLVFRQDYEATSGAAPTDAAAFFGHETNALDRLSEQFARAIVSAILEAF